MIAESLNQPVFKGTYQRQSAARKSEKVAATLIKKAVILISHCRYKDNIVCFD
ncbi:hypothetical protein GPLA_3842 [Paraglaciecola polaris LMG 21857]|uniref:Uncharacterized protein n=1 Tax=Paraglaciecola polaris LMG 21857 TaxID=1129793 RepID=K6ZWU6_9ALTE|nr:hypothetical protein GPLA_3842 [Paraglaciecola polaris LMG 21857]